MQKDNLDFLFQNNQIAHSTNSKSHLDLSGKRVLVLVDEFRSDSDVQQIEKIFAACKIPIQLLLITNQRIAYSHIVNFPEIKEIFLFNIDPKEVDINYQLFMYRFMSISGKKVVLADSLQTIMGTQQVKEHFWKNCLQPYYLSNN